MKKQDISSIEKETKTGDCKQIRRNKRPLCKHINEPDELMLEKVQRESMKETKLLSETRFIIPPKCMFKDYSPTCRWPL